MRTYSVPLNEAQLHMIRKLVCEALRIDALDILTSDQENILCEVLEAVTAEKVYA